MELTGQCSDDAAEAHLNLLGFIRGHAIITIHAGSRFSLLLTWWWCCAFAASIELQKEGHLCCCVGGCWVTHGHRCPASLHP